MTELRTPRTPIAPRLHAGAELLRTGRPRDAVALLRPLAVEAPGVADVRRLLGLALRDIGDLPGAEIELKIARELDPMSGPACVSLSELLLATGRPDEALAAVATLAAAPAADIHVLSAYALALKATGRLDEAIEVYRRAAANFPGSAVAEHNLAGALGDGEHFADSEQAVRRAFAKGLDAPQTWLVLARALVGLRRYDEAERAYFEVTRRQGDYVEALGELAQLIWMRTEDVGAAVAALDKAIAAYPNLQALRLKKAELLDYCGEPEAAYQAVADVVARPDAEPMMHVIAARLLMRTDPDRAERQASIAARRLPGDQVALSTLCEAHLARGDVAAALAIATALHERAPLDQHSLGLVATAWRLAGDPRYGSLCDYQNLVRTWRIDTPDGWSSLEAYLSDLTESLGRLHTLRTHPIGQSVRHGSQTSQSLTLSPDPVIQAFFKAIDGPIRRHIEALGPGGDPVRSRATGGYRFNGVWSIRLRPHGFHADHLHPSGWLSSACYIALPKAVETGREGWLQFGHPGIATRPALDPEHFVKPEPGLLALFPSYMWHGTIPFSGDQPRLTIAFDVVPG